MSPRPTSHARAVRRLVRGLAALVLVATPLVGCPPTPRAIPEEDPRDAVDDVDGATAPKAEGSLAALTFVVTGPAEKKYRSALERALGRAELAVIDPTASPSPSPSGSASAGASAAAVDLELRLAVSVEVEELIDKDADPDDPNTLSHETARYTARISVVHAGKTLVELDVRPDVELRVLTSGGAVVKTVHTREQADLEFSGGAMNLLVAKLLHADAVRELAETLHAGAGAAAGSSSSAAPTTSASAKPSSP